MRRPDWRPRLDAVLRAARREPFEWGRSDCATLCAACVEAMTGLDLAAPFRGAYETQAGGLALVQAAGFADHVAVFAAALPEIAPRDARPGDVVVLEEAALGIVQGRFAYAMSPGGLALAPLSLATRAFRV